VGIVRFALKYPHTFYVVAALILFLGVTAAVEMPTDLFPEINIPVVSVIWQYTGLDTTEMEQRVTTYSEYTISTNVNGVKDMEAETVNGISVQKIYFQPDVNLDLAIAQIVSATNSIRALLPTGIEPPIVVQYSASAVPVLQIDLTSDVLNESQLYDYGYYKMRQILAPIHGVTLPTPAGGKYRQIMVDIDQTKLLAKGLTPLQVVNAVNAQNLTLTGMLLRSSMLAGVALVRTVYCVSPILAVPDGSVRFCAFTAFTTSSGVSPLASSFAGSRSTMIWRYLPPAGVGNVTPWIGASRWRRV